MGKYAINVQDANAILNVSFIGYQSQTVRIAGRRLVTITLEDDETALKDIVIVGYGTMKKSDVTGSVAVVDTKEMMKKVPTNVAQALQGVAAGVYVSQQDGAPDANTQIRIRGYGTINGISQPLYVIDGIKVEGSNANFLNPGDIETIEVLKDASATAIYGSEGANGVVMITTKHGQAGRTQVQFNVDFGVGTLPYKLDVIGVDELAKCIRNARINGDQVAGASLVHFVDGRNRKSVAITKAVREAPFRFNANSLEATRQKRHRGHAVQVVVPENKHLPLPLAHVENPAHGIFHALHEPGGKFSTAAVVQNPVCRRCGTDPSGYEKPRDQMRDIQFPRKRRSYGIDHYL